MSGEAEADPGHRGCGCAVDGASRHSPVGREDETCHVEGEPLGAERRHCETCGGITRGWGARMVLERGGGMRLDGAVDERGQHARVC